MLYLLHTAHAQLLALCISALGWILIMVSLGTVEWRIWEVSDISIITSGIAWVGVWRVCFYSHAPILSTNQIMFCQRIHLWESFTPPEIASAQVLMISSIILGFFGNACVIFALRNVYFGFSSIIPAFFTGGVLLILTASSALVPVCWNLSSVVNNYTVFFPESFLMPSAPLSQSVGPGIIVGFFAPVLLVFSGLVFLSYRSPKVKPIGHPGICVKQQGIDNPAFQTHNEC